MLRWFLIGAVLGPVLLVATAYFVGHPWVLAWVAGGLAVGFLWILWWSGRGSRQWQRENDRAVAQAFAEAEALRRLRPD